MSVVSCCSLTMLEINSLDNLRKDLLQDGF